MKRIGVIGGGISGLSIAQCLKERYEVKVFEKEDRPGGLIKCNRVNGNLYHMVGGHVFNSRRQDVLDWFWKFFDRDSEFLKATRNAIISMPDGLLVEYPIENHAYQLKEADMKGVIVDLMEMAKRGVVESSNFEEFLLSRFGETLYKIYFKPYNEKIWKKELKKVPLSWLAGKLPMPSLEEIVFNNFNHVKETHMVHSSFYYAKQNGSQFLADRLAEGLDINYNAEIFEISKKEGKWFVNGNSFDKIIFCGNIKDLPVIIKSSINITPFAKAIEELDYHGTTSVLCEVQANPYSWIYLPGKEYPAHRIICTGNFAQSNNAPGKTTATIEFTDYISKEDIETNLAKIPFKPKYLTHQYTKYTYPIQNNTTRDKIYQLKIVLESQELYLLGRFAEWEYYNMDAAIGAAIDLNKRI